MSRCKIIDPREHSMMVKRFADLYTAAPQQVKIDGRLWYADNREAIRLIAATHNVSLDVAAQVTACLSPNTRWAQNIAGASIVIAAFQSGASEAPRGATLYYSNAVKAWAILAGNHIDNVFKGAPKVKAFYRNLIGNESVATVDVWMVKASGLSMGRSDGKGITDSEYARVAAALETAAHATGETVAAFQAIVWIQIRGSAV